MTSQFWWHLSRSSGIVAWLMLTGSVLLGVVLASDLFPRWRSRPWLTSTHRWLAVLTLCFLGLHLGSLLGDAYLRLGALDYLLPFHSVWRPTAVAAGVIAVWLLLAVQVSAYAAKRLSRRWWRDIHLCSYWVFWAVSVHAALAGTDAARPLYVVSALVVLAAVVAAISYRIFTRSLPRRRRADLVDRHQTAADRPPTAAR